MFRWVPNTPDTVLETIGLMFVGMLWCQDFTGIDGLTAIPSKLATGQGSTIMAIRGDTVPHLIASYFYWILAGLILLIVFRLIRAWRRRKPSAEQESLSRIETTLAGMSGTLSRMEQSLTTVRYRNVGVSLRRRAVVGRRRR